MKNQNVPFCSPREFSPYGELLSQTNPQTGQAAAVDCVFAYTGRALDEATGLQNNDERWYEAITGRWLSQDPIGFRGGINLYEYVGDSPVNGADPSGNAWHWWWPFGPKTPPTPPPTTAPTPTPPTPTPTPPASQPPTTWRPVYKPPPGGGPARPLPPGAVGSGATQWSRILSAAGGDRCKACAQIKAMIQVAKAAGRGEYAERLAQMYALNCMGAGMP